MVSEAMLEGVEGRMLTLRILIIPYLTMSTTLTSTFDNDYSLRLLARAVEAQAV